MTVKHDSISYTFHGLSLDMDPGDYHTYAESLRQHLVQRFIGVDVLIDWDVLTEGPDALAVDISDHPGDLEREVNDTITAHYVAWIDR